MIKKIFLLGSITAGLMFQSCSDNDFGGVNLSPVSVTTSVVFGGSYKNTKAKPFNAKVIFKNTMTAGEYVATTDANGNITFPTILPGTYTVSVELSLSPTQFEDYFGYPSGSSEDIVFNGLAENITIATSGTTITIEILASKIIDGLVIKQVYYGGSSIKEGASFRDQFIEIYNNSSEVVYADGLIFAQLWGSTSIGSEAYHLPSGQFDWSKGEGNTKGLEANTAYSYGKNVYRIPGYGKQYPINPGESIIIAATAVNHALNYTDNDGKGVTITNPSLTVDLSHADFEANLTAYNNKQYRYDIQNPNVPDLEIVHWTSGNDMVLNSLGNESFVIFRATDEEVKDFGLVRLPDGKSSTPYLQIPNEIIIDGVELTRDLANGIVPKKLATSIDAGRTYLENGAYSSTSIIRKTKNIINGRIILQDTNNSTADFVNIKALPKGFAN